MDQEGESLEERLNSFLVQLQTESGIFERIIYKGKNQHRRCLYFQYLLKVRRDVRLLQSARLENILRSLFQLIKGNKPAQTVHLLESLKKRKVNNGKHNYQERLLGVARLLSQMVEPMVKAATEISSLLARSFFMGFSLTILALLARLRVLVQQMLLDVVSVFNMVSSLSQKKHSVKLTQDGIEVFREYYPTNEEVITLECIWKGDKFVLLERTSKSEIQNQNGDLEVERDSSLGSSMIKYQSIEALLGDEPAYKKMDMDYILEERSVDTNTEQHKTDRSPDPSIKIDKRTQVEDCGNEDHVTDTGRPTKNFAIESGIVASTSPCPSPKSPEVKSGSRKKVAFISVRKPAPSEMNETESYLKATTTVQLSADDNEDPFFSLLTGRNMKDSLF